MELLPRYGFILTRQTKECWLASRAAPLAEKYLKKWVACSPECKMSIVDRYQDLMVDCFNEMTEICEDRAGMYQLDEVIYSDLEHACRSALGNDVVLQVVGSLSRATCGCQ